MHRAGLVVGVEGGGHSPEIAAEMRGRGWMAEAWYREMMDCSDAEMSRRMDILGKVPTWLFQRSDGRGGVKRGSGGKHKKIRKKIWLTDP
jgi:hypothetical protein